MTAKDWSPRSGMSVFRSGSGALIEELASALSRAAHDETVAIMTTLNVRMLAEDGY